MGVKFNNRAKFNKELKSYVRQWGESSQDDHPAECEEELAELAEEIVAKYYRE